MIRVSLGESPAQSSHLIHVLLHHNTLQRPYLTDSPPTRRYPSLKQPSTKDQPILFIPILNYTKQILHNNLRKILFSLYIIDTQHLDQLCKSPINRRPNRLDHLPEVNSSNSTLRNSLSGELELLVHILIRSGGTEAVKSELLVRVFLPSLWFR